MGGKEIRDAVHGDIEFDPFELDVINTPQFQRLRGIRQLGLAHLVYPCAQHSRFEHSLGVAHMAERIVKAVQKNGGKIDDNERRFIRALALIHDIGHIPFGHTLEDERPVFSKDHHHDCSQRLEIFLKNTDLEKALRSLGKDIGRPELVNDLIRVMRRTHEEDNGEQAKLSPRDELFAAIVGNTICADLLDYLKRDPYFTGIQHRYDDRIIGAFKIEGDQIYLDLDDRGFLKRSIASEILHLLRLRYTLGERVYYHLTKSAASAMISKAVELSGLSHTTLARFRDEELLFIFENAEEFPRVTEEAIQHADLVSRLVKNIRTRQLHIPVYTVSLDVAGHRREELVQQFHHYSNVQTRRDAENLLAKRIGASPDQVIIYCPDKGMATKAAMVNVKWPREHQLRPLQTLCDEELGIEDLTIRGEINQLKQKHKSLWQMNVFLDPSCHERALDLSVHCQEKFYNLRNSQPNYTETPLQYLHDRVVLEAITSDPEPDTIDLPACRHLIGSDDFKQSQAWTPDEMQHKLPRKSRGAGKEQAVKRAGEDNADLQELEDWYKSLESNRNLDPKTKREVRASMPRLRERTRPLAPGHREALFGRLREQILRQGQTASNLVKKDQIVAAFDALVEETRPEANTLFDATKGGMQPMPGEPKEGKAS